MKNDNWKKRYLEQRPDMQVSTRTEPRLLNEDKMLKFISEELKRTKNRRKGVEYG